MLRPSRAWIQPSRSSERQPSRAARARPTVVLPAPIKPTSDTTDGTDLCLRARDESLSSVIVGNSGSPFLKDTKGWASLACWIRLVLALLEVDFTTEGKQLDRRSGFAQGA